MLVIPNAPVLSIAWIQDKLVDLARGQTYDLEGRTRCLGRYYAYSFDSLIISPSGRHAFLAKRLGTKGLLIDGTNKREVNRSYYQAAVYDYPSAIFQLPDGRDLLAHCPIAFNEIVLEDCKTGEVLTQGKQELDYFYSRLEASPSGRYLLSAGWVWHPHDSLVVLDVAAMLETPDTKAWYHFMHVELQPELESAAFIDDSRMVMAMKLDLDDLDREDEEDLASIPDWAADYGDNRLIVMDLESKTEISSARVDEHLGTISVIDEKHVLSFYEHPKLIEVATGRIVQRWPEIPSGNQRSSISSHSVVPPIAVDRKNRRFAVAYESTIYVVTDIDRALAD